MLAAVIAKLRNNYKYGLSALTYVFLASLPLCSKCLDLRVSMEVGLESMLYTS